ncbi:MAG: UDP-N-acetylglucosamine 1-carboxyvinyltransferase [Rickettsiales bacterium]|nr:UDP-N-acetylglucosamine 1-carboxyvinyltransferase [Rickettsiales bacterium]
MDKIVVVGNKPLYGTINIVGAKNAALPLMVASLLTKDTLVLDNVPKLSDVVTMSQLLINHGVNLSIGSIDFADNHGRTILLNSSRVDNFEAPYDIVRKMRASILVLGPLLARFGYAKISLPGGCAIGTRPVNLHLDALKKLGATIQLKEGYIEAQVKDRLKGCEITFFFISVGATENILMAASLAEGTTILNNVAQEPEVSDLANLLNLMGAQITGIGTNRMVIKGVSSLKGAYHKILPDRIEAGTYAIAALITNGEITLENISYSIFENIAKMVKLMGGVVVASDNSITIKGSKNKIALDIITGAYPAFPTDMQAQFMTALALCSGVSKITENIFENRYMHVPELNRMGADISVSGNIATINGVKNLYGASVMATDLRASVSLVLAGLAAKGETVINRVYHIDRGYERIEEKLSKCGANIFRCVY